MWFALVVAVVLVAVTVAGVMGRVDGSLAPPTTTASLAPPTTTASYVPLPEDRLTPADLDSLRLDTAFRGYRMEQVDAVIGRLGEEIRVLTQRLEAGEPGSQGDAPDPDGEGARADPLSPDEPAEGQPLTATALADPDSERA
ncbi:MAG: DivIVA domain-containing protein [Dermatophilaceae bacterium]